MNSLKDIASRRLRAIRKATGLGVATFRLAFKPHEQQLDLPALSRTQYRRWEKGRAHPGTQDLNDLLAFLEDPVPTFRRAGVLPEPGVGPRDTLDSFPPHRLEWFDPLELREGLERLVNGILSPSMSQQDWERRLERCDPGWSMYRRHYERRGGKSFRASEELGGQLSVEAIYGRCSPIQSVLRTEFPDPHVRRKAQELGAMMAATWLEQVLEKGINATDFVAAAQVTFRGPLLYEVYSQLDEASRVRFDLDRPILENDAFRTVIICSVGLLVTLERGKEEVA